jgi:hypothetical protein
MFKIILSYISLFICYDVVSSVIKMLIYSGVIVPVTPESTSSVVCIRLYANNITRNNIR